MSKESMVIDQDCKYDVILDAREDPCPMPLLKSKMALSQMQIGETLCVVTCDSGALKDIPQYVSLVGFSLLSTYENDKSYTFVIQKN